MYSMSIEGCIGRKQVLLRPFLADLKSGPYFRTIQNIVCLKHTCINFGWSSLLTVLIAFASKLLQAFQSWIPMIFSWKEFRRSRADLKCAMRALYMAGQY